MGITLFQDGGGTKQAVGIVWQTLHGMYVGLMQRLPFIVIGLIVFAVFVIIGRILQRIVVTAGERTRLDVTLARLFGRLTAAGLTIFGLLVAAVVILPSFRPGDLIAGLGITSVAVGFAFKDVLQNFFAGVLLLWRRPFIVGDEIKVREFEGKVEEISVRSTRIRTSEGIRAIVPNGDVYTSCVVVKTAYSSRRLKLKIAISYPSDVEAAKNAILDVLRSVDGVQIEPAPSVVVVELAQSAVNLMAYFWMESRKGNDTAIIDQVATGIKKALADSNIEIALPHSVVLFHDETGSRNGDIERTDYLGSQNGSDVTSRPA